MRKGIDISNLQGPPSAYRSTDWYQAAEFVIVQAINPPAGFPGHSVGGWTAEQLRTAKADGKAVGVYVFLWDALDLSVDIPARLALIPDDVALDMRLWLDVEDTSPDTVADRRNDVLQALQIMDQWASQHGLPASGVYTGQWYIDGPSYLGGWFPPNRMEWIASYDQSPVLTPTRPGYQYYDHPVDLDAFAESEFITTPTETPTMAIRPGDGMVAQMHVHGDAPLFGHRFFSEVDDDQHQYSVEECYGAQGRYVSSNASGDWVNAGPF